MGKAKTFPELQRHTELERDDVARKLGHLLLHTKDDSAEETILSRALSEILGDEGDVLDLLDRLRTPSYWCPNCYSPNVEVSAWLDAHTDETLGDATEGPCGDCWCRDCETNFVDKTLVCDPSELPRKHPNYRRALKHRAA